MSYYTLTKGYSQELIKDMKDSNAELIKNPVKLTEEQKGNKALEIDGINFHSWRTFLGIKSHSLLVFLARLAMDTVTKKLGEK